MSSAALRLLRPMIRAASAVAPRTAGRLAFRAFCTPPAAAMAKQAAGEATRSASGRLAAAQAVSTPFPCGSVATYVFEPPGAATGTVVLVHGWSGRAAYMTAFVAPLLAAGRRVVAFDLPAHGASTGSELNVPIGVAALSAVVRAHGPAEAIIAHSFGGSIVMAAVAGTLPGHRALPTRRLALIASPASIGVISRNFGRTIGLGARGQAALERRIHVVAGCPVEAFEGAEQLRQAGLATLVVHCREDREVGFEHAERLAEGGEAVTLAEMRGVGHRRILQARPVVKRVCDFVLG